MACPLQMGKQVLATICHGMQHHVQTQCLMQWVVLIIPQSVVGTMYYVTSVVEALFLPDVEQALLINRHFG